MVQRILSFAIVGLLGGSGAFTNAFADEIDEVQVGAENDLAEGDAAQIQARHKKEDAKVEHREAIKATREAARAEKLSAEQKEDSAARIGKLEPRIADLQAEHRRQDKLRARAEKTIAEQKLKLKNTEAKLAHLQAQVNEGKKLAAERDAKIKGLIQANADAVERVARAKAEIAARATDLKAQAARQKKLEAGQTRQPSSH